MQIHLLILATLSLVRAARLPTLQFAQGAEWIECTPNGKLYGWAEVTTKCKIGCAPYRSPSRPNVSIYRVSFVDAGDRSLLTHVHFTPKRIRGQLYLTLDSVTYSQAGRQGEMVCGAGGCTGLGCDLLGPV